MMLNEEQAHDLMHTLGTRGWTQIIEPTMKNRGRLAMQALLMEPAEHSGEFKDVSDEALRYRVREMEWLLTILVQSIEVWRENERRMKQQETDANVPARGTPYGADAETNGEPVHGASHG